MFRKIMPGTTSRLTIVDHSETYGRHILEKCLKERDISLCVDLGCGHGDDLMTVKKHYPKAKCVGVDFDKINLIEKGIETVLVDIENQPLPFKEETVDCVIANQVLEHTKEIHWINHEIFRVLKVGGFLYLGVPNVLSFHNRILGLFGIHPTSAKMISAHVRVFSKNDTVLFYREVAGNLVHIEKVYGSQFYPFPKMGARFLSALFPSSAFSIFFVIRKTNKYNGEFIERLSIAQLETNFYKGKKANI